MSDVAQLEFAMFVRGIIVGLFGGVALILLRRYSRRGPLMYPCYALILAVAGVVVSQFPESSYFARFTTIAFSLALATTIVFVDVVVAARRVELERSSKGLPRLPVSRPWWGMPVVGASVLVVSAGVAALLR